MSKSVVFTFGRFNPPTTGHELLANRLRVVAKKERIREIRLYPSQSQDSKKNPLSFRDKVKFLRKAFSGIKVVADTSIKTIFQACEKLSDEGYKNVVLVVGGDRVSEFQTRINKYIGPDGYQFDSFKVVEAGKRDPDADDVTGMSASKLRGLAADGDYEAFKDGAPSGLAERDKKAMYNAVRKGMGIKEMKEENYEELLPEQFALAGRSIFDDEEDDDDQFTSTTPGTPYVSPFDPKRPVQRKQRGVDDVLPSQRPGVQPQQMPPIGQQGLVSPDQLQFPVQDPRQQPAQQPLQAGAPGGLGKLLAALKQKQLARQGQQAPQQQQMPQMPQQQQMQQMMQMMAGQQQQAPQQQQDKFATLKKPSDPQPQFAGGDVEQMSQVNRQPDAGQGLPEYGQGSGKKYNRQEILDKLAHGGVYQQPDNQKFTPFGATFKVFASSPQERDAIVAYSQRFSRPGDYHQVSYGGIEPRGGVQKYVVVIMVNNDAHFQEFNQYLQSMRVDFEELTLIPGQLETPEQKQAREQAKNAPQQQQGMMPGMGESKMYWKQSKLFEGNNENINLNEQGGQTGSPEQGAWSYYLATIQNFMQDVIDDPNKEFTPGELALYDYNDNGTIDFGDLTIVLSLWSSGSPVITARTYQNQQGLLPELPADISDPLLPPPDRRLNTKGSMMGNRLGKQAQRPGTPGFLPGGGRPGGQGS